MELSQRVRERFWACVNKSGGHWIWSGTLTDRGYGRLKFKVDGKHRYFKAHRLSWQIHYGPVPEGLQVLHHCDIPACVNPACLFLGTHQDNMADMLAKGRAAHQNGKVMRGENNRSAKLTALDVIEILADPGSYSGIATRYGISPTTVVLIKQRQTWRHVAFDGPIPTSPRRRLNGEQVAQILASQLSNRALGEIYGVDRTTIRDLRRLHAHIEPAAPRTSEDSQAVASLLAQTPPSSPGLQGC